MTANTLRTPENAELICRRIVEGLTLRQIGLEIGFGASAIAMWSAQDAEFNAAYLRAKQAQMDIMAEEVIDISDDGTNDWQDREFGEGRIERVIDKEHVHRSRLRVDTRKWLMARFAPKRYGDRMALEHGGEGGGPIIIATGVVRNGDDVDK